MLSIKNNTLQINNNQSIFSELTYGMYKNDWMLRKRDVLYINKASELVYDYIYYSSNT